VRRAFHASHAENQPRTRRNCRWRRRLVACTLSLTPALAPRCSDAVRALRAVWRAVRLLRHGGQVHRPAARLRVRAVRRGGRGGARRGRCVRVRTFRACCGRVARHLPAPPS
jgi:hypothetical protein